ncbi:restriction modification system DNA specificity domain [Sulfuricurvum kujiense DSM 16994]|uniref:Restriction modification system DNA specificity domain n=1 Tax=Sulfuricurvum kujiense (strain ATCC BAA-921 / DSM 16994 / JCM 11577 / YK-1) TaxID=709032 RepID=E4U1K6_SULKY|nr:restriction endonuclease subunit S [Sulfuricurvum kujiense]ADR33442.1 restriction modification system DNA specificity domain [Sulfuricurvum kujiense DSM 16994]
MNKVLLGDILTESKVESLNPDPNNRITVRLNVKGVEKRPVKNDTEGATKYYIRSFNQFIYGKQNLFKGAFGIIPKELDGFETSSDLPCFDIDINRCKPEWILYFFKKGNFYKTLEKIARGAGSKRISPKDFFKIEIPLPSIDQQESILNKISSITNYSIRIEDEIFSQQNLLKKLRQSILQEAIEGKLTAQWRKENSDVESVSKLLKKIRDEKERLIKEKKIKKGAEVSPILTNDIPFIIPQNWGWCRLGNLLRSLEYGTSKKCFQEKKYNTPILRIPNISSGIINVDDLKFTDLSEKEKAQYTLENNDILIIRSNGSREIVGRSVLVSNEFQNYGYAGYLIRLRFIGISIDAKYIQYALRSPYIREQIEMPLRTTVGINNINSVEISNLLIPLPPIEEQNVIVEKVENLFAMCDDLEQQINESKANAEMLMQSVLKEAFEEKSEVDTTEPHAPKTFQRSVLAAYLIDNSQDDQFFGHVKLQKMLYMCEAVNNLDFDTDYKRHAMGPYDPKLIRSVDSQLKKAKWFEVKKLDGEISRYVYHPLEKVEEYKKYVGRYWDQQKIEHIFHLMKPMRTLQAEIVATLYSAYTDLKKANVSITDAILINEARNNWHDNKKNIAVETWEKAIEWMKSKNLL